MSNIAECQPLVFLRNLYLCPIVPLLIVHKSIENLILKCERDLLMTHAVKAIAYRKKERKEKIVLCQALLMNFLSSFLSSSSKQINH